MESPTHYAPIGVNFFASDSSVVGNGTLACNDPCALSEDCSTAIRNGSWNNTHTSDPSSRGERLGGKPTTLVQHTQCTGGSLDG